MSVQIASVEMKSLIIIGMHRSGTSVVAGITHLLGFNLGLHESMGPLSDENPKGFWEQMPVRNMNDYLLDALDASWDNPFDFDPALLTARTRFDFFRLADRFVSRLSENEPWAMKDPRFALTLDAWKPIVRDPVILLVYRDPIEVAKSLNARDGLPAHISLALWERYVVDALNASVGFPRVLVRYSDVIRDPVKAVKVLYSHLSDLFPDGLVQANDAEIESFVDRNLYRQKNTAESGSDQLFLTKEQADLVALFESGKVLEISDELTISDSSNRLLKAIADLKATHALRDLVRRDYPTLTHSENGAKGEMPVLRESKLRDAATISPLQSAVSYFADFLPQAETLTSALEKRQDEVTSIDNRLRALETVGATRDELIDRLQITVLNIVNESQKRSSIQSNSQAHAVERLREIRRLLVDTRKSWRWRTGDQIIRMIERLLLRPRPMLALDSVDTLLRQVEALLTDQTDAVTEHSPGTEKELLTNEARSVLEALPKAGKLDIIIYPIIDWHFRIQRPQHIARELARLGHRVFYLTMSPLCEQTRPGYQLLEMPEHGVFLCELQITTRDPITIYHGNISKAQEEAISASLRVLMRKEHVCESISLVQHPSWGRIARRIPGSALVYDCMDNHAGFSTHTRHVGLHESELLANSEQVIVTSDWLKELHKETPAHVIRNAAQIECFQQIASDQGRPDRAKPVAGYIGTIAEWFDIDLIVASALKYPDWDFVLVGSTSGCDISKAEKLPNVEFKGEQPYSKVPGFLAEFDVCMIPFKITDLIKATNPVKVYEYLAAGKPVVTVDLPELQAMKEMVHIAGGTDDWLQRMAAAMAERDDNELAVRRKRWAATQTWASRAKDLDGVIHSIFPKISIIILTYNNIEFTRACINSVLENTHYPDYEVIVVDNASSDGSREYLRSVSSEHEQVTLIQNEENLGFAGGNNVGMRRAAGDVVILLNNDTYVTPGWAYGLARHMKGPQAIDIVGPVTNNIGNEAMVNIAYDDMEGMIESAQHYTWRHWGETMEVENVAFFCVAIRSDVIDEIGLLDEDFAGGFFEDDDYCMRARIHGKKIAIAEDVFVHHHLSASFDKLGIEKKQELFESNKAVFAKKWGAWKPHSYRK